jgi:hypothetical protein
MYLNREIDGIYDISTIGSNLHLQKNAKTILNVLYTGQIEPVSETAKLNFTR